MMLVDENDPRWKKSVKGWKERWSLAKKRLSELDDRCLHVTEDYPDSFLYQVGDLVGGGFSGHCYKAVVLARAFRVADEEWGRHESPEGEEFDPVDLGNGGVLWPHYYIVYTNFSKSSAQ
uniref:Hemimethylated DNA-binding domain-containing protein n=1 Tax=Chromera velia CCMP2878 TaxID=1169474 RepID=A0A0K6S8B3_9ALVE|eukprot:Cvel_23812.t2-p1 / transcript=Cvel_23812.t2 / gene=Cvel_23812 / organism=Chromera_velia_CCMP2878 / gene_product=hypothetical protein / transcript_product=hypothetical protein / location=Cvel_scaffold2501:3449-3805(-) / protein_length=119 / sequence_SO=supercontig / SO=protein_coding / is_pseudo=false